MKNKKIALFLEVGSSFGLYYDRGFLERELVLYRALGNYCKEIIFFTYGNIEEIKYQDLLSENIKILPKKWRIPSVVYTFLLPFLYKTQLKNIDILKTNQMLGFVPAVIAKLIYRKKLIIRCGFEWFKFLKAEKNTAIWKILVAFCLEKLVYNRADKIIITSEKDKEFIVERFRIPSSRIEVIPNYVDTNIFKPANVQKEENTLCFIGRLNRQKNIFNLLKAVKGLNIRLKIIGDGPLRKSLEEFARRLDLKVDFRGVVPNRQLPVELNKSELFILPSLYEGNPKVLLEAMACALPCIGTHVEGIAEIIKHKENGYLCKTDAESIRKAIVSVLNDKELQSAMSQNAINTVSENFCFDKILQKELKILEAL